LFQAEDSQHPDTACLDEAGLTQALHLLSEALAPDDGRAARCRRVMDGLCGLIDADAWFWPRSRIPAGGAPVNLDFLYGGALNAEGFARLTERALEATGIPSEHPPMRKLHGGGVHFTAGRRQMVDDDTWRSDPTMAPLRRAGFDELLYSWLPLNIRQSGTLLSGGVFLRAKGKPAFEPRHGRLVHLVLAECASLHLDGLDHVDETPLAELTPRQRTVLAQLVDGHAVPQTAAHLGLSVHTVNDHVKAIYRHFDVQSRAELMSRLLQPAPEAPA